MAEAALGFGKGGQQGSPEAFHSQPLAPEYTSPGIPQRRSSLDFPSGADEEQGVL